LNRHVRHVDAVARQRRAEPFQGVADIPRADGLDGGGGGLTAQALQATTAGQFIAFGVGVGFGFHEDAEGLGKLGVVAVEQILQGIVDDLLTEGGKIDPVGVVDVECAKNFQTCLVSPVR
jgi:hypothetical protein